MIGRTEGWVLGGEAIRDFVGWRVPGRQPITWRTFRNQSGPLRLLGMGQTRHLDPPARGRPKPCMPVETCVRRTASDKAVADKPPLAPLR
jgi:hypothetical protein